MQNREKEVMRAVILVVTLEIVIALAPTTIMNIAMYYFWGYQSFVVTNHSWAGTALQVSIFLISFFVARTFAKKHKWVEKVLEYRRKNMVRKLDKAVQESDQEYEKSRIDAERVIREISDIVSQYAIEKIKQTGPYDFELSFNSKLNTTSFKEKATIDTIKKYNLPVPITLPVVRLGDSTLHLYKIVGNKATVKIDTIIPNEEFLNFYCGDNLFSVGNPYWLVIDENDSRIVCQLEGLGSERNVYIAQECFSYLNKELLYTFRSYRNGEFRGEFDAQFSHDEGCVKVPIGKTLNKADYHTGECQLRYSFGTNVRWIVLPEPRVFSVNGRLVKEAIF